MMTLITVLSVMNGFHKELRDRVLGAISHSHIFFGLTPLIRTPCDPNGVLISAYFSI
jgi:ABC-type lipoprotein release transport system permease subunit